MAASATVNFMVGSSHSNVSGVARHDSGAGGSVTSPASQALRTARMHSAPNTLCPPAASSTRNASGSSSARASTTVAGVANGSSAPETASVGTPTSGEASSVEVPTRQALHTARKLCEVGCRRALSRQGGADDEPLVGLALGDVADAERRSDAQGGGEEPEVWTWTPGGRLKEERRQSGNAVDRPVQPAHTALQGQVIDQHRRPHHVDAQRGVRQALPRPSPEPDRVAVPPDAAAVRTTSGCDVGHHAVEVEPGVGDQRVHHQRFDPVRVRQRSRRPASAVVP